MDLWEESQYLSVCEIDGVRALDPLVRTRDPVLEINILEISEYSLRYYQRGVSNSTNYVCCPLLLDSTLEYRGF